MQLLPTQIEDAAYLADSPRLRGSMFSAPGTGKTLTALAAVERLDLSGTWAVIAPPIALRMWAQNIESYLGVKAQVLRSSSDKIDRFADFYVTTYGLAGAFPHLRNCVGGIADEADALKTLSSQRTKAIYGNKASGKNCLIENMDAFFPLTGTPIRRYADDLYPWFKALHPAVLKREGLGTLKAYQEAFCVTQMRRFHPRMPMKATVIGNKNEALLKSLIYGQGGMMPRPALAKRRTIHDVSAFMPDLTEREISVGFEDSQELREASNLVDYEEGNEAIMAKARRLLGLAKADACAGYILDVVADERVPVLVLYWHRAVQEYLRAAFEKEGLRVAVIDGATSTSDREKYEDRFNAGSLDILLGQIQSMGVSLNLQKGSNRAVFVERDWSPSSQEQGYKRLWRLGQEQKVMVDYCLADHPIEEAVTNVNARKQKSNDRIIG